ncbi:structural maintenance of chromosomes protein 1A-like [Vespula maculifrons]|uniref:Structural maintenance of chromosomes protein n=1 Tax=Vespula maculifrons TaxID=7453 RepID=A0ABD2CF30_VESMC
MRVHLQKIILYNFKSFCGEVIIGPFQPFTTIIGPNGAGKSNIMDAISFVMGEKISSLRVSRLNDLISKKSDGTLMTHSAHVTVIFEIEGRSKEFTRGIHNSSNIYKINNQVVKVEFYKHKLASLGLNIKSKSFLVFQGNIEAMCITSPKEISIMFDEISKSAELKSEYERLKNEMHEIDLDLRHIIQKKKCLLTEKKRLLIQQQEAEEYNLLQEEYHDKKTELQLFRLFHIRRELGDLKLLWNDNISKMNKYDDEKKSAEIILEQKKKKYFEVINQETMMENNLITIDLQETHQTTQLVAAKEKISHLQQKIPFIRTSLTKAHLADEVHNKTMKDLQKELTKIEVLKMNLTQSVSSELESQGSNMELDNAQVKEYYLLKGTVQRECVKFTKNLNVLRHDQENDQNKLDNEKRKKIEVEDKKKKLQFMLKETEKRLERLEQYVIKTEVTLTDQKNMEHNLETDITQNKIAIEEMKVELDKITNKLNDITIDKFTVSREYQKLNTITILKDLFPEVYGRLFTLCKPIHERYNIAVTKVLWKYKDAIIVKTEKVAKQCIEYLKRQQISVETFLPLDSLKIQPFNDQLKNNLSDMIYPKTVQFLYDVIEYFPKEISNAISFVTKNTLLCETSEDARKVAYESHLNDRYTCVALDGSYYQKSGIISGGSFDLSAKSAIWKDKQIQEMKLRKVALIEKIKKASKCIRKQSELNTMNSEILSLTNKLKYSRIDVDNIKKQIVDFKQEIENIDHQLISIFNNIESIEKIINKRYNKIQDIENQICNVEDRIFSVFCRSINITNIRVYEKGRLRIYGEQKKRECELENQYNRIKNALDFEKHYNTKDEIEKYEIAVQAAEEQLKIALEEESAITDTVDKQKDELKELRHIHTNIKTEVIKMKNEVAQCRHQIGIIAKLILETRRERTIIEVKIKQKKIEMNNIFKSCQMEDIIIPMSHQNTLNNSPWVSSINTSSSNTEQSEDGIFSKINFSFLLYELQIINGDQFDNVKTQLLKNISTIQNKLDSIPAPNLKAGENLELICKKLDAINKTLKDTRNTAHIARNKFTRVKEERISRFMKCFDYLTFHIDYIYKYLLNNMSAQATLVPYNPEEPYLDDINYSCIVPGKRFHFLSSLSGGEQVLAILTLLFAIHRYEAAPFIILDEIDAALDKINIVNVVNFIRSNLDLMHFITISLKKELFVNADGFIGVTARQEQELVESSVFLLSFESYGSKPNN